MKTKRKGLLLGRTLSGKSIWQRQYCHTCVFAPTGAGKGVSLIVPTLLTYDGGSVVTVDPKGENFHLTAAAREATGQLVVRLDPFGVCGPGGENFNPLDQIARGPECIDACRALSAALVIRTGEEKDPHWNDQAENVITGGLAYICANFTGSERSLSSLREILCSPEMLTGCAKGLQGMGGVFARLGSVILSLEDKEKASVLSTVHRHVAFLDSPAVLPAIQSGFDAEALLTGNVALYLVLPPDQLIPQARLLRMWIASLLRLVGQRGMGKRECLFVLDEAGQLGHMQPLEQALTLLRSAGVRLMFFFQSLGQLKECFREKESVLLDNCDAQFHFGVNSLETAKRVSEMLGDYTEVSQSHSVSASHSRNVGKFGENSGGSINESENVSTSVHKRALLAPDEVIHTTSGLGMICFVKGLRPIFCQRILYYSDPLFVFRRFQRLRQILKRLMVSLLVGVLFSALVNSKSLMKGDVPWQPNKSNPAPSGNRSTISPPKR